MKTKFLCVMVVIIGLIRCPVTAQARTEYDFAEPSNVSTETLENALYDGLEDYAYTFIKCEEEHGVNAVMLAAIAALESGWGTSEIAEEYNNLFGWKTEDGDYRKFYSKAACIRFVAECLSENYLNEDGSCYTGGTTVRNIRKLYCDHPQWEKCLNGLIEDILWRCENEDN